MASEPTFISQSLSIQICICVRNGSPFIEQCIDSILDETHLEAWQIIVVDHLSTDETPSILARYAQNFPDKVTALRFEGEGLAVARNFAASQVTSDWFAFVDADCVVQSGWARALRSAVEFHHQHLTHAAIAGTNLVPTVNLLIYDAYRLILSTYVGGHSSILNRIVKDRIQIDHAPTLNVIYRRQAFEEVGGFDPAFTKVGEDLALSHELRSHHFSIWAEPNMRVAHALRPTLRKWLKNMFLYGRGRLFFIRRFPSAFEPKFFLPPMIVSGYAILIVLTWLDPARWLFLAAYTAFHFVVLIGAILMSAERKTVASVCLAVITLWLTHLTYGAGFIRECLRSTDDFR